MDRKRMTEGIRLFLDGMGQNLDSEDLGRTPERVAEAWVEDLVAGYDTDPSSVMTWTQAPADTGAVLVRGISFASVCIHHLLPFFGQAHIAYLPGDRLAGLSKLGRVVDAHARRLQTQEKLTSAAVATLTETLQPRGVLAIFEAEHTCMTLRGVRKEQARMTTVAASGMYESDASARREVLALLRGEGRA